MSGTHSLQGAMSTQEKADDNSGQQEKAEHIRSEPTYRHRIEEKYA